MFLDPSLCVAGFIRLALRGYIYFLEGLGGAWCLIKQTGQSPFKFTDLNEYIGIPDGCVAMEPSFSYWFCQMKMKFQLGCIG